MKTQNKVNIFIIVLLSFFVGWLSLRSYQDKQKLKNRGVYVIGIKYKYHSGNNHAGVSFYSYFYKDKKYEYSVADGGANNKKLFLIILPSDPNVCRIVEDVDVPSCLTMKDVPTEGWKELPLKICK
jgi:hypothetical protein